MKIGVIGTGYVGLVQGVILAEFGRSVICMDVDEQKINDLKNGKIHIYEPGLKDYLDNNLAEGRLHFSSDIKYTVENSEVLFIAVGTPPCEDGSADLSYVMTVAEDIGKYINGYKVIVNKSTVPIGTGKQVIGKVKSMLAKRGVDYDFDVVSNPEFLREGKAVKDALLPDRVVVGCESERAKNILQKVYDVLYINQTPFIFTNIETAELIKYAANSYLAVKISFINEMALLAEKIGANVQTVSKAMGMDGRISPKFLHAGAGFGGSCFPKDTKALIEIAKQHDERVVIVEAAIEANEKQKKRMVEKIIKAMGGVENKLIAVLGLSFKPDTDDMREAPSIDILTGLVKAGARIQAYCPHGMNESKKYLGDIQSSITYCESEYRAATDAQAIVIITEWNQFRGIELEEIKNVMKDNYLFDLRNIFAGKDEVKQLFKYHGVGV